MQNFQASELSSAFTRGRCHHCSASALQVLQWRTFDAFKASTSTA